MDMPFSVNFEDDAVWVSRPEQHLSGFDVWDLPETLTSSSESDRTTTSTPRGSRSGKDFLPGRESIVAWR